MESLNDWKKRREHKKFFFQQPETFHKSTKTVNISMNEQKMSFTTFMRILIQHLANENFNFTNIYIFCTHAIFIRTQFFYEFCAVSLECLVRCVITQSIKIVC